jgi:hypothetical protein
MIAGTEAHDAGADAVHDADTFVAENAAEFAGRHVPFDFVLVTRTSTQELARVN